MSDFRLPNTDLAASPALDIPTGRSANSARAASARKSAQEGSRAFRDLLGAMAQKGKAEGRTAGEKVIAAPQARPATQVLSAAASPWDREVARSFLKVADPGGATTPVVAQPAALQAAATAAAALEAPSVETPEGQEPQHDDHHIDAEIASGETAPVTDGLAALVAVPAAPVSTPASDTPWSLADLRAALTRAVEAAPAERGTAAVALPQQASATDTDPIVAEEPVEFRAAAPAKVSVVSQQTHLVPAATTSAVGQIADAVITDLPNLADAATTGVGSVAMEADAPPDRAPMRMLTVQLDPPDLGEVRVNMRLKGDNLELHVVAASHDTAKLLQTQRDALSDLIRDTGYQADIADVQVADVRATTSSGSANFGQNFDRPDSAQSNLAEDRRQAAADRGSDGRGNQPQRQQTASGGQEHAGPGSTTARNSAIYL
jgi:chemotaxis protein MotD